MFIKRLKILLNSNIFYIVLFIFTFLFTGVCYFLEEKEYVLPKENVYEGIVTDYKKEEDKLTLYLKGDYSIVATYYGEDTISYGDHVKLIGEYKEISEETIPYVFSYKNYLKHKDIKGLFSVSEISVIEKGNFFYSIKNWVRNRIDQIDEKGYLLAFILGDKSLIEEDTYENYSKIGVTHLFALSGMHVGILSGVLFFFLKKLPKGKYFIVSIFLIFYGCLVGFPSSLKRCIFFFILSILNKVFHLNVSSLKLLLLTFLSLVLFQYRLLFDIGFLYSFATIFGILLFSKNLTSNKIIQSLKISAIAFLFSLPISLANFYSVNFLSILYNLFYIPFVSILLYPFALLTFFFPFFYPIFSFFLFLLESITSFLSKIDLFTLYLSLSWHSIFFYYCFLLLFYKMKKKIFLFLMFLCLLIKFLLPYFDSNAYIYFFDVGQGDSCLILFPYRKEIIMIDTGGVVSFNKKEYYVSDSIITFMKHEGIQKIDSLILSHGDYDHMGDATNLVNHIKIEKVILNCGAYNDLENELIKVLDSKKTEYYSCINELNIDNNKLYFLNTKIYDNENDNSNVIYMELNNYKFLFMGDAGVKVEKSILEKYNLKDIDFLKVGHHGSNTSSSKEFINSISPKYSLISVGKNNRYGHPKKSVLDTLSNSNVYRTDLDGSIEIQLNKNGYKIITYNP